jgi:hypothetical protein
VHIHPSTPGGRELDPNRQGVGFGEVAELPERLQTRLKVVCVDSEVKVAVLTRLLPDQDRDAPAATHP